MWVSGVSSNDHGSLKPLANKPFRNGCLLMPENATNKAVNEAMTVSIEMLFPIVFGGEWKGMSEPDAIAFRDLLEAFVKGASMLREKFDGDIWAGHSDGTVSVSIKSVRAPRTGDKPGVKAKVLTPSELLAKRLGK